MASLFSRIDSGRNDIVFPRKKTSRSRYPGLDHALRSSRAPRSPIPVRPRVASPRKSRDTRLVRRVSARAPSSPISLRPRLSLVRLVIREIAWAPSVRTWFIFKFREVSPWSRARAFAPLSPIPLAPRFRASSPVRLASSSAPSSPTQFQHKSRCVSLFKPANARAPLTPMRPDRSNGFPFRERCCRRVSLAIAMAPASPTSLTPIVREVRQDIVDIASAPSAKTSYSVKARLRREVHDARWPKSRSGPDAMKNVP
jgi:hypothetical protein